MKKYRPFTLLGIVLFAVICQVEAVVIVANSPDKSIHLSRQEVRNLFMGVITPYRLKAIALPPNNETRVLFNTKVIGLTESRIQSYWAQMRFTGRKDSPLELANEQLVIDFLKNNELSVGYLSSAIDIPDELTVIFETE